MRFINWSPRSWGNAWARVCLSPSWICFFSFPETSLWLFSDPIWACQCTEGKLGGCQINTWQRCCLTNLGKVWRTFSSDENSVRVFQDFVSLVGVQAFSASLRFCICLGFQLLEWVPHTASDQSSGGQLESGDSPASKPPHCPPA